MQDEQRLVGDVIFQDAAQQVLLGFEIAVQRRLRSADPVGDRRHRRMFIAELHEQLCRGGHYLPPLFLTSHTHFDSVPLVSITKPYISV